MKPTGLLVSLLGVLTGCTTGACATAPTSEPAVAEAQTMKTESQGAPTGATPAAGGTVVRSEEEWRQTLSAAEFHVLRQKGTEPPFTGKYWNAHEDAVYVCAACGQPLFDSKTKFESGTGWPSFYAPISEANVEAETDRSHGMVRTEVHCSRCGGHLGHIFDDGPEPTGLRYCINSVSLKQQQRK